CQQYYSTPLTC
nr:immunoglobulin light chain junction region [Macaca mulatta]MPN90980.1 immunoglobulin light chain junction region [Macaca mulatta]MPN91415.1 immunoglobulin light chain junction region [Macaca mulatta]MPN91579.1 immunoglobulin light chain junction region [Macaca mulatta]MPN94917.1 immunoglobulin light chain junction region [Macaca mulatta]